MRRSKVITPLWKTKPLPQWGPTNPDHQWLTTRHGNHIPAVLTEPQPFDDAIAGPVTQWRTAIYRHLHDNPAPAFWQTRATHV